MNKSDNGTCDLVWAIWALYPAFIFSFGASVTNVIIVATILRYRALRSRKEYVLIAGLAGADCVEGIASLMSNMYRIPIFLTDMQCHQLSAVLCMIIPFGWMWRWSDFGQTLMLLMLSCDRFYAVYKPMSYWKAKRSYAMRILRCVYGFSTLNMLVAWIQPIQMSLEGKKVSMICASSTYINTTFQAFAKYASSLISASSVIVYVGVLIVYKKYTTKVQQGAGRGQNDEEKKSYMKKQRKLTKSLGISSLCTLLLDSIPRMLGMYWEYYPSKKFYGTTYSAIVWNLTKVNAMANFFIYAFHQKEIRFAIRGLFRGKTLPPNLNNWNMGTTVGPTQQNR